MEIGGFPFLTYLYFLNAAIAPEFQALLLVNYCHEIDKNDFRCCLQNKEVNSVPSILRLYFLFLREYIFVVELFVPKALRLKAHCHGYSCSKSASLYAFLLRSGKICWIKLATGGLHCSFWGKKKSAVVSSWHIIVSLQF